MWAAEVGKWENASIYVKVPSVTPVFDRQVVNLGIVRPTVPPPIQDLHDWHSGGMKFVHVRNRTRFIIIIMYHSGRQG